MDVLGRSEVIIFIIQELFIKRKCVLIFVELGELKKFIFKKYSWKKENFKGEEFIIEKCVVV